ncbi:beta-lactamase-like protein [Amylocystis lapponica]|nr:beta-lactamase-like protein [Amylocystis lapponica]
MSHDINITFLGSTSGGGPTETRNCSSLAVDALGDGSLWLVDCAEGTLRQFALQPFHDARRIKLSKVTKIFITHMHADHNMGIITILRSALGIPHLSSTEESSATASTPPRIEIYGPRGIRRLLRTLITLTHTRTNDRFAVHELLYAGEQPSVPAEGEVVEGEERGESEAPGRDIWCDAEGFWRGILDLPVAGRGGTRIVMDAGPIEHRDPCLGFVIREVPHAALSPYAPAPRTLVILGDTSDPTRLVPLIENPTSLPASSSSSAPTEELLAPAPAPPVALLVHEATDAHMPPAVDPQHRLGRSRTAASVEAQARARGHSTPAMAGAFAARIGAQRLVLNHLGARFPAPERPARGPGERFRVECVREIERQATDAWGAPRGVCAQAAWDFMRVVVPPNASGREDAEVRYTETRSEHMDIRADGVEVQMADERSVEVPRHPNERKEKRHRGGGQRDGDDADRRGSGANRERGGGSGKHLDSHDKRRRRDDDR